MSQQEFIISDYYLVVLFVQIVCIWILFKLYCSAQWSTIVVLLCFIKKTNKKTNITLRNDTLQDKETKCEIYKVTSRDMIKNNPNKKRS